MDDRLEWFKSSYSDDEGGACVEVAWRKSSHSDNEGGACVEVAWRKSRYSDSSGGACVEIAAAPEAVHVRDSKDPDGPRLTFTSDAWASFVAYARQF